MRCLSVLVVCWCALSVDSVRAAEPFPYTGYIAGKNVYVRSGPGKNYYPTDKLQQGTPLEIWRHDPGGWFAVRPPEGSYSWVRAKYLRPTDQQGVFVVAADRVIARVGSKLSDQRDVIQIRLERGEEVEVLKTVGTGSRAWCKVAPPAGEFRWVFGQLVERRTKRGSSGSPKYGRNALIERVEAQRELADKKTKEHVAADVVSAPTADQVTRASYERPINDTTPSTKLPEKTGDAIDRLELELTRMVTLDAGQWNFTALRKQAETLLKQRRDAPARGRLRSVLNRIKRLDDIRRRYDAITAAQQDTDRRNASLDERAVMIDRVTKARKVDQRFDASGRLIALKDPRSGQPPFALVDPQGNIVSYATPAPGVNLRGHVGQTIGVHGLRSQLSGSADQQVVVKHVRVLKK
ncbi:MAG: SH3 domain-containing protein [Planctomycetes bacterium]|nr:SH3 domain-containing protein [Planctomycetota bacterium]